MNHDEIKKIAHLARVHIPDDQLNQFADMKDILDMVAQMDEVDTSTIEPMSHPLNLTQRLRKDEVTETDQREALQAVAPDNIEAGYYLVPEVFEDE